MGLDLTVVIDLYHHCRNEQPLPCHTRLEFQRYYPLWDAIKAEQPWLLPVPLCWGKDRGTGIQETQTDNYGAHLTMLKPLNFQHILATYVEEDKWNHPQHGWERLDQCNLATLTYLSMLPLDIGIVLYWH